MLISRFLAALLMAGLCTLGLRAAPSDDNGPLQPTNLGDVNSKADDDDPFLSASGHQLYYATNLSGRYKILISRRTRLSQPFARGKGVKEVNNVDEEADYRCPFLTRDGKFYYASNTVPKDPDQKFVKNFDLYFARQYSKRGITMGTPVMAVCTEEDELYPWLAVGGKEFYFSRKTKDGWRVLVAKGPALGAITAPKLVDLPVDFHHATLSPNGLTMYLQGPVGKGRWGLFRTTRSQVGGRWNKPVELAELNNAEGPRGDLSPSLSQDGTRLYFASDRPGGKGGLDIWMISVAKLTRKSK